MYTVDLIFLAWLVAVIAYICSLLTLVLIAENDFLLEREIV